MTSEEIYQEALQKYLSYFIDEDTLEAIHEHQTISNLMEYGEMIMGFKINETIQIADAYASVGEIKTTEEEVYVTYPMVIMRVLNTIRLKKEIH